MTKDRWLATIELIFTSVFWGVGYFLGFNLLSILSVGTVSPEEFSFIIKGRVAPSRYWVFMREGRIYLKAEIVALGGWFALLGIVWTIALLV